MSDPFVHRLRVRYGEVDLQGVVFNAHWLAYFDDAMTRFFEDLGFDPLEAFEVGVDVMIVHADVDWHGPAGVHDTVDVDVTPSRLGESSLDLRFEAEVEGRAVCSATITYVVVSAEDHRPTSIPDPLRAALSAAGDRPG